MEYRVQTYRDGKWSEKEDFLTDEEPLQITVDGCPIAVVMRTRGNDEDLVFGFLRTEGMIDTVAQVGRVDLEQKDNHAYVFLADDVEIDTTKFQRNLYSASSCGICGKASIESIQQHVEAVGDVVVPEIDVLLASPTTLRKAQQIFDRTGGVHAAGLFKKNGELLVVREDVGRHNAVDKVIGWGIQEGVNFSQCFIQVSGRVSFEVMQKALVSGISCVSAISAPSSLAVDFANETGMALYGFVRGENLNRYS